jgi:hypothetical protein
LWQIGIAALVPANSKWYRQGIKAAEVPKATCQNSYIQMTLYKNQVASSRHFDRRNAALARASNSVQNNALNYNLHTYAKTGISMPSA